MATVVRDLIEYSGIADYFPESSIAFRQFTVENQLCIPCQKPESKQLLKVEGEVSVKNKRIIKTPKGKSLEGQVLTGWKVLVEGYLKQKIQYVSASENQSIHVAHFQVPFSSFVVLPDSFLPGSPITVTGYIEDIFVHQLNCRCFYSNTAVLLDVEIC